MTELLIKNILAEILFDNRICESLDDQWIVNYLYDNLLCEKLLYGEPVNIEELRNILRKKIVNFQFIKLDGEIRDAKGTLMMKYVPQDQHPKGIRPSSPKVATFFDLDKTDWRSVSQRSKEIVLKKDEETGKPIVMVKDKPEVGDVAVKDKDIKQVPKITPEKPTVEPTEKPIVQPEVTVDKEPITQVFGEKPKAQVIKVKPIESTENKKMFYFVNTLTKAKEYIKMTAKDAIKALKKMGANWRLADKNDIEEPDETTLLPKELGDYLETGDIRNYLNNKGENVPIEIVAEDPDGGFYAKTLGGGTFKIPANRMQNIGQKIENKEKTKSIPKNIINKEKDLENIEANEI